METRDDPTNTILLTEEGTVARAARCPVDRDHWWITQLHGDRDQAGARLTKILSRLRGRHAAQVWVAPQDVRPELGRPFYAAMGFCNEDVDDEGRYPMRWSPNR